MRTRDFGGGRSVACDGEHVFETLQGIPTNMKLLSKAWSWIRKFIEAWQRPTLHHNLAPEQLLCWRPSMPWLASFPLIDHHLLLLLEIICLLPDPAA